MVPWTHDQTTTVPWTHNQTTKTSLHHHNEVTLAEETGDTWSHRDSRPQQSNKIPGEKKRITNTASDPTAPQTLPLRDHIASSPRRATPNLATLRNTPNHPLPHHNHTQPRHAANKTSLTKRTHQPSPSRENTGTQPAKLRRCDQHNSTI